MSEAAPHTVVDSVEAAGPLYSVVVPVYRSAEILPLLVERLDSFFASNGLRHEYVLVNDGSPDNTWQVLEELARGRDDIIAIDLLRNYGQHSAVFCGLEQAQGDFAITIDDDLQNPPEELIHLIRKIDEGYDVVFGEFHQKMHGLLRRAGTFVVGWLNKKLFGKPGDLVLTNVRIMRREVIDAVCSIHTTFPYIPGLVLMSARTFANAKIAHHPRHIGRSHYGIKAISRLIWRIVFNYSAFPLRVLCGFGVVTALFSFALGTYYLVHSILVGSSTPGWPTLVVLLSFYQGLMLIIFAAVGEYLVKLVNDVSGQRAYQIRKRIEAKKPTEAPWNPRS